MAVAVSEALVADIEAKRPAGAEAPKPVPVPDMPCLSAFLEQLGKGPPPE